MSTPRKTSKEISDAIITQLETSLSATIPILPKAFIRVLSKVLGGVFVLLYQYAGFILLQMFVKTASNKEITIGGLTLTPLKLWASLVGLYQKTGDETELEIEITVLSGDTLTSGEKIVNPATEVIYVLVGDIVITPPTATATIRATQIGEIGNVDVGTELSFVNPPASVEKEVEVTAITTAGVDPEETDDFRQRTLERYAARPQGGAYADYRDWAEEVTDIKNAYPYSGWGDDAIPDSRTGQVFVYCESASQPDGIPLPATLVEVKEHIEEDGSGLANRRNINAYVWVFAISRVTFDIEIIGLAAENLEDTKTAIEEGLTDYFKEREPYITGLSIPPRKDIISEYSVGGAVAQIAAANSGTIQSVVVSEGGAPIPDNIYYLQEGEKAKLGTITWS